MVKSLFKLLIVASFLAVFALGTFGLTNGLPWLTILAEDFNECRISGFNTIQGEIGYFIIQDTCDIIQHEVALNQNGYILFNDKNGDHQTDSSLIGVPIESFLEDKLYVEFDLSAGQEDSNLATVLSDEDDLDVLVFSTGNNGCWFVNGEDICIPYKAGVVYTLSIMVEVDPNGGPALYAIHCQEKNQPETYILLDTGLLLGFEYGQMIDQIRFEKPSMTPSGVFILDNVIMQLVTAPVPQNGTSPNNP
jgi:hypothetical protein